MKMRLVRPAGLVAWVAGFLVTGVVASGCYETPKPACAFRCGPGGACPDSYTCQPDNVCHLVRSGGRIAECDEPLPPDASVDASPFADAP